MTAPPRSRRGPVVGHVLSVHAIPDATHVRLARVDVGEGRRLTIVFGGTRDIGPGDAVPVAPPGSWVPGPRGDRSLPVKMRRRRYRGQVSEGMLCSLRELGWARLREAEVDATRDEVAVLDPELAPGSDLPGGERWRECVVEPDPRQFGPNTLELDLRDLRRQSQITD